mmetsp:Transcript_10925/g.24454  ORF Transcript_10925/g.24454 Transcript_10925/m.24454 type:complete len:228 (-) Transcript_10925:731-1414(-)
MVLEQSPRRRRRRPRPRIWSYRPRNPSFPRPSGAPSRRRSVPPRLPAVAGRRVVVVAVRARAGKRRWTFTRVKPGREEQEGAAAARQQRQLRLLPSIRPWIRACPRSRTCSSTETQNTLKRNSQEYPSVPRTLCRISTQLSYPWVCSTRPAPSGEATPAPRPCSGPSSRSFVTTSPRRPPPLPPVAAVARRTTFATILTIASSSRPSSIGRPNAARIPSAWATPSPS